MAASEGSDSYTIGWIAALPAERAAATALLDERYEEPSDFQRNPRDQNIYAWGRMGKHNIVIASAAEGVYGITQAALTASEMVASLPQIRIGLLVGIGGGIARPDLDQDVRLGDVVVSRPQGTAGGVVQYDFGKSKSDDEWERRGSLNKPPTVLLNALAALRSEHYLVPSKVPELLQTMWTNHPYMKKSGKKRPGFIHQGFENDRLFSSTYCHVGGRTCKDCDTCNEIERDERDSSDPEIHYGIIASGSSLVANASTRDRIAKLVGKECLCIEMEAAGLMDRFPCLVIRGICDYADTHKNDAWQEYAAATAAAYAKELLSYVPLQKLHDTERASDALKSIKNDIKDIQSTTASTLAISSATKENTRHIQSSVEVLLTAEQREKRERITNWLAPISFSNVQRNLETEVQQGTGQWFMDCSAFQGWMATPGSTLWCPGIAGAGKTAQMSVAVAWLHQHFQNHTGVKVACAYCDYKDETTHDPMNIAMGLWRQLLDPDLEHTDDVRKLWDDHVHPSTKRVTKSTAAKKIDIIKEEIEKSSQIFLLIDALDEIPDDARPKLLEILRDLQASGKCNVIVTSRPYQSIAAFFENDSRLEISAQWDDLLVYIKARAQDPPFKRLQGRIPTLESNIVDAVIPKCEKMFLLARLYMDSLKAAASTVSHFKAAIKSLPTELHTVYSRAIQRIQSDAVHAEIAMQALYWVTFATRPLSVHELIHALAVAPGDVEYNEENELLVDITSICAALVVIDRMTSSVRLAHYTTEEYLKASWEKWYPQIFYDITSRMLTYVSFDSFQKYLADGVTIEDMCSAFPFLQYATLNWGNHMERAQNSNGEIRLQVHAFLCRSYRVSDLITKKHIEDLIERSRFSGSVAGNITALHIAVLFNLIELVPFLQEHERSHPSIKPLAISPLNLAARMDRIEIAKALLDGGADTRGIPEFAWRPMHQAARWSGTGDMITLLLDHGADINVGVAIDPGDDTSYSGHVFGQSPIYEAAFSNNVEAAKVLIQRGADVSEVGKNYSETAFSRSEGNDVFPLLLDALRGPKLPHDRLMQALVQHRKETLRSLIERGLDVNQLCFGRKRALDYALDIGDTELIGLLLENGAIPGDQWVVGDYLSRFATQQWSPLLRQVLSDRAARTQHGETRGHGFDENTWDPYLHVDMHDSGGPQVSVLINDDIQLPVQRLVFTTDSHDQGWSDARQDHGTYRQSYTGFDVRLKQPVPVDSGDEHNSGYSPAINVQWNVHASVRWRTHVNVWDRLDASPEVLGIMNQIKTGSTVEFIAWARYPGWQNFVKHMRLDVYGFVQENHNK